MKTFLAAAVIGAFAFLPAGAIAQNYEQLIADQYEASQNPRGQKKPDAEQAAESIYGESRVDEGSDDETSATDSGYSGGDGGQDENSNKSYDQMAIGEDGPQDIYSYISGQEDKGDPTASRNKSAQKAHQEALNARKAAIGKMKANSDRLIRQQKARAWQQAHPGEEMPGEDDGEGDEAGYSDEGGSDEGGEDSDTANNDSGDSSGGDDSGGEGAN